MAPSFRQTSSETFAVIRLEGEPDAKLHLPAEIALAAYDPERRPRSNCRIDAESSFWLSHGWIREDGVVEHVGDDIFKAQVDPLSRKI